MTAPRPLIPLALLLLLLPACRAAQQPYDTTTRPIDASWLTPALQAHVSDRIAMVVGGADVVLVPDGNGSGVIRSATGERRAAIATAVAVTDDGYYLTAAHCVDEAPTYLVVKTQDGPALEPVRVVWSGRGGEDATSPHAHADLAIVKVQRSPKASFAWAEGNTVAHDGRAIGVARASDVALRESFTTGVIRGRWALRKSRVPSILVLHDAPLANGASGGPLFDRAGRLVGINVGVLEFRPASGVARKISADFAVRPDRRFIARLIQADRRDGQPQ